MTPILINLTCMKILLTKYVKEKFLYEFISEGWPIKYFNLICFSVLYYYKRNPTYGQHLALVCDQVLPILYHQSDQITWVVSIPQFHVYRVKHGKKKSRTVKNGQYGQKWSTPFLPTLELAVSHRPLEPLIACKAMVGGLH